MRKEFPNNSFIQAPEIEIGPNFHMGDNVHIYSRQAIRIGKNCRFGDDVVISAQDIMIGDDFFHLTPGLRIGGGGSQFPEAYLRIGDRCVLHNNYINLCMPVIIGNDVGLSPNVEIITHGFWQSVLEGYPTKYESVSILDGAIVGQSSTILMGSRIGKNVVVGAKSLVTGDLEPNCIYAGNPCKKIREITKPTFDQQIEMAFKIIASYDTLLHHAGKKQDLQYRYLDFPIVKLNGAKFNLLEQTIEGEEDDATDEFRDFLRRYGIRIYTDRPFKCILTSST